MSDYIQIPNKIQDITKRSKLKEIYAYGLIRSQIKDNSYLASLPLKELAELGGWDEKTSHNYVVDLMTVGLISDAGDKKSQNNDHRYNVYKLEKLTKDYSLYRPDFFSDPNLTSEQKGLLMLLKSHCIPGTRHMPYPSIDAVRKILHIDRGVLSRMMRELICLRQVRMIGKTLVLTNPNILLATDMTDYRNWTYEVINRFCVAKGVVPPTKNDTESKNLGLIAAQYPDPRTLLSVLVQRFRSLPPNVTLSYFAQGLRNMHAKPIRPKAILPIIL